MNTSILLSRHIRAARYLQLPFTLRAPTASYSTTRDTPRTMTAPISSHQRRGNRRFGPGNPRQGSVLSSVPSSNQVIPGAAVSIVLKLDQPTGREVPGVVQDVLTRHDHPRGIKVRLTDGRVGRVQRMVSGSIAPSTTTSSLETNGIEPLKYRDIRLDDEPEAPPTTNDLSAYIKPAKQKKRKGQVAKVPDDDDPLENEVSCPVCGDFKGDEAAVAHHVQSLFE
ncbi:hypothetical protein BDZ85DRAFT_200084 [Elsinoe ampelina]|uniref:Uncharacterized protein n=1 Tax=Elsinoe ampelina TaxID=302913 RepID=A0A6A6G9T1_9PEZI|nr:hypothetical protein BDZ85DRAFT_200084 [Elsinoe ampelina]